MAFFLAAGSSSSLSDPFPPPVQTEYLNIEHTAKHTFTDPKLEHLLKLHTYIQVTLVSQA